MKIKIAVALLIVFASGKAFAQITTATNGLNNTADPSTVLLGGTLTTNTSIDLGTSFTFNLKKATANYFHMLNNGNIGIGLTNPTNRLHLYKNTTNNFNTLMLLEDGLANGYTMMGFKGLPRTFHVGVGNQNETTLGLANKFFIRDQTATSTRFVIDANGNVGIGTTTPSYTLDVTGTGRFTNTLAVGNVAHPDFNGYITSDIAMGVYGNILAGGLRIGYGAPQTGFTMAVNGPYKIGSFNFTSELQGYTKLGQANNATGDFLTRGADGSINIRTAAQVVTDLGLGASSTNAWSTAGNPGAAGEFLGTTTGLPLIFKTNGLERMKIDENGSVGIGTTNPLYKLDVNGSFLLGATDVNSELKANGGGKLTINTSLVNALNSTDGTFNIGDYTQSMGSATHLTVFNANSSGNLWVGANLNYYTRLHHSAASGAGLYEWYMLGNNYRLFELGQGTVKMPVLATGTGNGTQYLTVGEDGTISKQSSGGSGSGWSLAGNAVSATDFLGTTNANPLVFKTDGSERMKIEGSGNLRMAETSNIVFGANNYPHGNASIGYGGTNGGFIYHHQMNDGPTVKVELDANNVFPVFNVSGNGAYLQGGLFNVDYNHYNSAYSSSGYKANMSASSTLPGGEIVGFNGMVNTAAANAYAAYLTATTTGSGKAYGIYVDASQGTGGTGDVWGMYVNRGKTYFNDNVGIGTTTPAHKLDVNGNLAVGGSDAYGNIQLRNNLAYNSQLTGANDGTFYMAGYNKITLENNKSYGAYRHFVTFEDEGRAIFGDARTTASLGDYKVQITGGLLLKGQATEQAGVNGGIIYNSATNQFKGYRNGAWKNFLMDGDASGSSSSNAWSLTGNTTTTSTDFIGTSTGNTQPLVFKTNGNEAFRVNSSGQISIGTDDPKTYKLAVNGDAIFTKVKVKAYPWADYVFEPTYKLPTLQEVEAFIKQHKHLPDVPSAKEVEQNGIDVGSNQAVLLKKIEELTLYMIELNKKVDKLDAENKDLKKKLETSHQ